MAQVFATPAHQHRQRGRLRPVPDAAGGAARVRLHLAAGPHVALRQGVANLRRLVPWVKRAPSEYIREHVRLTIQPLDAPGRPAPAAARSSTSSARTTCCCTPATTRTCTPPMPRTALLRHLPEALARKIRSENARALYGLLELADRREDPAMVADDSSSRSGEREPRSPTPALDRLRLPQRAGLDQGPLPVPVAALARAHRDATACAGRPAATTRASWTTARTPARRPGRAAAPKSAFSRSGLPGSVQRRLRHAASRSTPAGAPAEPRSGRRAGHGRQRLADRRVARPRAAPARLDRRSPLEDPTAAVAEIERRGARQALRPGAVLGPAARADGAPQVLADLRGLRQARPAHHVARLRLVRQPDHRHRLAVLLPRGPRRPGPGDAGQHHQPGHRGRLRALPDAEVRLGRERLRLDSLADVADGQRLDAAQERGAAPEAAAVRVHPRARVPDHPAGGGAAQAGAVPPAAGAVRRHGRTTSCSPATTRTGTRTTPTIAAAERFCPTTIKPKIYYENGRKLYGL